MAYRRISLDERADWLLMLEAAGFVENPGRALAIVSRKKGAPAATTLSRWWNRRDEVTHHRVPSRLANEKRPELTEQIFGLLNMLADEMPGAIDGAPLSQLSTSFGILFDKYRLLTGESTSNSAIKIQVTLNADD